MIAYFALLSFVPLLFLALALLGLVRAGPTSRATSSPSSSAPSRTRRSTQIVTVVRAIQRNAATLGIVGGIFLVWSSLSLFSVLESAFNIVYGRPNRAVPARQGARDRAAR